MPPLTFNVGDLMDDEKLKHGPLEFLWNQDEWIPPRDDAQMPPMDGKRKPPRYRLGRLMGMRPFYFAVRVGPPPEVDLYEWGTGIAKRLGVPWHGEPKDDDKAIWLPGIVMARSAAGALGSCKRVFDRLDGLFVGSVAIRAVSVASQQEALSQAEVESLSGTAVESRV